MTTPMLIRNAAWAVVWDARRAAARLCARHRHAAAKAGASPPSRRTIPMRRRRAGAEVMDGTSCWSCPAS